MTDDEKQELVDLLQIVRSALSSNVKALWSKPQFRDMQKKTALYAIEKIDAYLNALREGG